MGLCKQLSLCDLGLNLNDARLLRWANKYHLYCQFVGEYGYANVPTGLHSPRYPRLGSWVQAQRAAYSELSRTTGEPSSSQQYRISAVQIELLERLGFQWEIRRSWEDSFSLLQQYVREHGTARVPRSLDSDRYPKLGPWVGAQRAAYRRAVNGLFTDGEQRKGLSTARIQQLEGLGFEWKVRLNWDTSFDLLRQYVQEHGTARVPRSLDSDKYPKLGTWVNAQQTAYRNEQNRKNGRPVGATASRISDVQIALLEGLGFEWKIRRSWDENFNLLQQYVMEFGTARVPRNLDSPIYPRLGLWVYRQRLAYGVRQRKEKEGVVDPGSVKISAEQIQRLNELGFEWKARLDWGSSFDLLQQYVHEHGNARVPRDLDSLIYPKLGPWVHNQRLAYRARQKKEREGVVDPSEFKISAEQIQRLEGLGFEWKLSKICRTWEESFNLLQQYVQEHGHARMSCRFDSDKYPKLGRWVSNQRHLYRNTMKQRRGEPFKGNVMPDDHIERLTGLGFEWKENGSSRGSSQKTKASAQRGCVQSAAILKRTGKRVVPREGVLPQRKTRRPSKVATPVRSYPLADRPLLPNMGNPNGQDLTNRATQGPSLRSSG